MSNEFKITDVVDKKAITDLQSLKKEFNETATSYAAFAEALAGGVRVSPKTLQELSDKSISYNKALTNLIGTQNRMAAIQEKQINLLDSLSKKMSSMLSMPNLGKLFDDFASNINKASKSLESIAVSSEKASSAQSAGAQSTQQSSKAMQDAAAYIGLTNKAYTDIISSVISYDKQAGELNKNLSDNKIRISEIRSNMSLLEKEYKRGAVSKEDYSAKNADLLSRERGLSEQNKKYSALLRSHAQVIVSTAGSYDEMSASVLQLERRYKTLGSAQRDGVIGTNMLGQIDKLKSELKNIDSNMGNYQRNVGNYKSHWNGLGMSVQQVARELPSLAMGWNTFFLAISNNLPILSDELKKANAEFKAMQASGQRATPVWKQMAGAIFNWQTVLVVGITLLSVYGKDIINWTKNIFNAKEAINDIISAERMFVVARREGVNSSIKERTELKSLYKASQDISRTITERRIAIEELQKKYPDYFGNLSDEEILAGKAAESYEKLTIQILKSAQSRAIQDKLTDRAKEQLELEDELNNLYYERSILNDKNKENNNRLSKGAASATNAAKDIYKTSKQIAEVDEKILEIQSKLRENEKQNIKLQSKLNVEDLLYSPGDMTKEEEKRKREEDEQRKKAEKYTKERLRIQQEYQQSKFDLMDEGFSKELAKISLNYTKKMAEVKGQSKEENATRENIAKQMQQSIEDKTVSYSVEKEKKDIANKLEVVKKGSKEELNLRIEQIELQRDVEMREAIKNGDDLILIEAKYNAKRKELDEKYANEQNDILQKGYAGRSIVVEQEMENELSALANEYTKGIIDKEKYEEEKLKIQQKYAIKQAELAVEIAKLQLGTGGLSEDDEMELKNKIAEAEITLAKLVADANISEMEREDDALKKKLKNWQDGLAMVGDALNAFADLGSAIYERKIEEVEGEQDANQEAGDAEIERITRLEETGAITKEEAEARKRSAEQLTANKEKELAKKKADLQMKQAKMDKANAISQAIIQTALAVMNALNTKPFPLGLALAITAGTMGAVQLATIMAQPIPKYAKGTDNHPGGLAVVGDGGREEMIISGGRSWITPSVPTLVNIPKGAAVFPDVMNMDSIRNMRSDVMLLMNEKSRNGEPVTVNINNDYKKLEGGIDRLNSSFEKMAKYQRKAAVQDDLRRMESRL